MATLKKELGLLEVFSIASGAMISSGLFILPGLAHAQAGPAVVFSYFFAGILAATGMLSVSEIITAMPKPGGDYFFITRTMGPAAGTVAGLLSWFSLALKSAFALVGMSAFLIPFISWNPSLVAALICLLFVAVNIIGAKEAGKLQIALVFFLFSLMVIYIALGSAHVSATNFSPFVSYGWNAVFSTAGLVFVSYGGLLNVASVAGEVKNPGRVIPLSMILSITVVTAFYTLMVFITSGVLSASKLDNSMTPISDGASLFWGEWGFLAMSLAAAFAFISTANAGILSSSRYLMSLSQDGLIPTVFGNVSNRFQTPHIAVMTTGALIAGALFLRLEILIKAASTVLLLTYIFSNLCVIVLRESRLINYRPTFCAPLYPWIQIAGIVGYGFLLIEMGFEALFISMLLIMGGIFFYWFYGRIKAEREYALLHLVERLSDKQLSSGLLEHELKEIIRERDDLCLDRFDELVEEATVLDLEKQLSSDEFFDMVARKAQSVYGLDAEETMRSFQAREKMGSTVVLPGIIVTDIIVTGQTGLFKIIFGRCRKGIGFTNEAGKINAFFILLTSEDERHFYLRAVTAIAQIIQDPRFEKKWLSTKTVQGLRDLLLLGSRKRVCLPPVINK